MTLTNGAGLLDSAVLSCITSRCAPQSHRKMESLLTSMRNTSGCS